MRSLVRRELDLDKSINLKKLAPHMKVYAGVVSKLRETKLYKDIRRKQKEKNHTLEVMKMEKIKNDLLAKIYKELTEQETMKTLDSNAICSDVILQIPVEYEKQLNEILTHKDFLAYDISRVPENKDIRLAFIKMPILLRVKKKIL